MSSLFILGILIAAAIPVIIAYMINRSTIKKMEQVSASEESITEILRPTCDEFKQAIRETDNWAHNNNFYPFKLLQMQAGRDVTYIATWQDKTHARLLLLRRLHKNNSHEFVTRFGEDEQAITLSTSDDKNTHALPTPPDIFSQSFSYGDLDMLLGEHTSSEAYIEKKYNIQRQPLTGNIRDEIFNKCCSQCTYIKSLMFWQFKGPYWCLFRRQFRANAPVKTLY